MEEIKALIDRLIDPDNKCACGAMKELAALCETSNAVYPYIDTLDKLLDHPNSYVRNRALTLIAANAKWDTDNHLDQIIDRYLRHVSDMKPITARTCIKGLPEIIARKPHLSKKIERALRDADPGMYPDSMAPLVRRDIRAALAIIQKQEPNGSC